MRKVLLATCLSAVLAPWRHSHAGAANANDELIKLSANPKEWVMRPATMPISDTRTQSDHRSQCRQVAGGMDVLDRRLPATKATLIVGNTMYVHTPFPNKVYALICQREQDHLEI